MEVGRQQEKKGREGRWAARGVEVFVGKKVLS